MDEFDRRAFADLVNAVVMKCFGHSLDNPLSEPESKHLSTEIEERTGLVIGWRSVKNYVAFVLNPSPDKQENPSMATLDTLARYVLNAPVTTEAERKKLEEHFPYWFRYREQVIQRPRPEVAVSVPQKRHWLAIVAGSFLVVVIGGFLFFRQSSVKQIQDDFQVIDDASLSKNGWFVQDKNNQYWNRKAEQPGRLTLFTLKGDNWPKTGETPRVQNLLLREIQTDCFRTEVHFSDFVPTGNWQQAGLLLLEDTLFTGKSIRLSLSYNDYFGGYNKPGEILIQAIASYGKGDKNLEEFVHQPLFPLANANDRRIATTNLKNLAFRIEKQAAKFRLLYSVSPVDNFSFKEITSYEFEMSPKYIGLFALKGFVDSTAAMPVSVRYFRLDGQRCE
ncbi:hypothetical protein [Spirosoma foliorum]|uniref:Uncharacterized protein n=1 Tax=Spirosoma foliorum TaxID=2710596 RepID=A0A7G5GW93_9BACT|nr:hypothetical protein [Spirosoma foliorum]QMW03135.1 hypothetical protein H3H32_35550 [Spirosoma foliorum]